MALLLIQSSTPGLLTLNGQFCGRIDETGHTYLTPANAWAYLTFSPFDDALRPLTREIHVENDTLASPPDGLFAICWPEGVCQLELRPTPCDALPLQDADPLQGADDVQRRPLGTDATLVTGRKDGGMLAVLLCADGHPRASLHARRLTWDTPEIVQAFEDAEDFVGHATLCSYRVTPEGFTALTRQSVWAGGAPRWPTTPAQTLRAYLEALCFGAFQEAAHYLCAPERTPALPPFTRVTALRQPLTHAPEQLPLALGILSVASPTLAHVRAVCARARAQQHAQGAYKLEEISLL